MIRRKCRIWWPTHLSSNKPQPSTFLYGWILATSSASIDIVVAFTAEETSLSSTQSSLEAILHETNRNMPAFLQDKCKFSRLGYCAADSVRNGILDSTKEDCQKKDRCFGCHEAFGDAEIWVKILYCTDISAEKSMWIPKLHHMHLNGQILSNLNLHVIIYETPRFGSHHFSVGFNCSVLVKTPLKQPRWVEELDLKQPLLDMDTIVLAINCANAAKSFFEEHALTKLTKRFTARSRIQCMFANSTRQIFAMSVATFSTLCYIIIRFLYILLSYVSQSCVYHILERLFSNTWKSIRIRSCQILYWPVFLQNTGIRSKSCIEYEEIYALQRHFTWSAIVVDFLLGVLTSTVLLLKAQFIYTWISNLSNNITNNLLRMGCVWLMGNPAGFKLNIELAGILGLISLNAIQIWSTFWHYISPILVYCIQGLALSGIIFGLTTLAALAMDMISLATLHVSTLHWFISLLYSRQISAITAFWRLFRGQKLNPLRQRSDSYNYTVEQHVIGSLLFTPLLLVFPTTCAFYIFFTMMNRSVAFICLVIEVIISIIRSTPYTKLSLWLVRRKRFPCGIWFEISSKNNTITSQVSSSFETCPNTHGNSALISVLRCNTLNIRQLLWPHYRHIYYAFSRLYIISSAYGALTGRLSSDYFCPISSGASSGLPSKTPWMMFISYKVYWRLCYDALLTC